MSTPELERQLAETERPTPQLMVVGSVPGLLPVSPAIELEIEARVGCRPEERRGRDVPAL